MIALSYKHRSTRARHECVCTAAQVQVMTSRRASGEAIAHQCTVAIEALERDDLLSSWVDVVHEVSCKGSARTTHVKSEQLARTQRAAETHTLTYTSATARVSSTASSESTSMCAVLAIVAVATSRRFECHSFWFNQTALYCGDEQYVGRFAIPTSSTRQTHQAHDAIDQHASEHERHL